MSDIRLTEAQERSIYDLDGPRFIAAGAGSGKTGVVTRRFVFAVASGRARVDQILTITFTNKAAAEMLERIRTYLRRRELLGRVADDKQQARMAAAYQDIELAQISTIHSFCSSLLRTNALDAGIDPEFVTADEARAGIISEESFDIALRELLKRYEREGRGIDVVSFISAYDEKLGGPLYLAIRKVYGTFRSQGRTPELAVPEPPALTPLAARLVAAGPKLAAAIEREGVGGKATAVKLEEAIGAIHEALKSEDASVQLATLEGARPKNMTLKGLEAEIEEFLEARQEYVRALRTSLAVGALRKFNELLALYDAEYVAQKEAHGMLDFSDLELRTLALLQDKPEVRKRVAARYELIMVDEYQDINPLQHQIISLLSADGDNLCFVGDENQSIFGFRDAEVDLFRDEKRLADAGGYLETMADNFRSHGDILAFVDFVFDRDDMLRPGYLKLKPGGEPDGRDDPRRVEMILVDSSRDCKKEGLVKVKADVTRPAEARLIAERLNELYGQGLYSPGDTAILINSHSQVEIYRQVLSGAGIRNYQAAGVGFFGKLEFGDALSFLKLLVNPLDDLPLVQVLRSPYVGVSDDTLFRLRNLSSGGEGGRGPLWPVIAGGDIDCLIGGEREKVAGFAASLASLRGELPALGLQRLARRAIGFNGYDATLGALRGRQAMANLMKLVDLAAAFEDAWGHDLPSFIEFLEYQKDTEAKEADASVEQEGVDAVRIMTLHSAKGLEFPLVVLPELSSRGSSDSSLLLIDRDRSRNRVGLAYKTAAIDKSCEGKAFDYEELKREKMDRESAERRRLYYVGMTRAESHLILSGVGAADRIGNTDLPLNWLRHQLGLADAELAARHEVDAGGLKVGLTVCDDPQAAFDRFSRAANHPPEPTDAVCARDLDTPPPASFVPSFVSPTALDTFRDCPLRFYYENVLYAGDLVPEAGRAPAPGGGEALRGDQRGTLVHAALEELDLALPLAPDSAYITELAARVFEGEVIPAEADIERAIRLIGNLARDEIYDRIRAAASDGRLMRELRFSTMVGQTILGGMMDVLFEEEDGVVVVDYKSGRPPAGDAGGVWEKFDHQMSAYALAAGRHAGKPVEVAVVFLEDPVKAFHWRFRPDELPSLESSLQATIDRMAEGSFLPLEKLDPGICYSCAAGPRRARFCIHGGSAQRPTS